MKLVVIGLWIPEVMGGISLIAKIFIKNEK